MSVKSRLIVVIALLLLAACSAVRDEGGSPPTEAQPSDPNVVALQAAQAYLAEHLGVELQGIQVAYGPGEWTDTSLGCPQDGIEPEERVVAGFTFEMTVDGTMYELRTDKDGGIVVLCPEKGSEPAPKEADLPPPAEIEKPLEKARTVVSESLGVPLDSVDPGDLVWESVTFPNSGLGCPEPDTAYLEVLTEGFALTFTFQDRAYEVHTDLAGDTAVLCPGGEVAGSGETPTTSSGDLPGLLEAPYLIARTALADELGVSPDTLAFEAISWEEATFPSTALGCPEEGLAYAAVEVDGYIFSLTHSGAQYHVHTDLSGTNGVLCRESEHDETAASSSAGESSKMIFTSFGDDTLGFGISYPLGWTVEPAEAEGEVLFRPAGNDPTLGMIISRLNGSAGEAEAWMSEYQITLYSNDPTAIQIEEPHQIGPGGQSQLFSREIEGTTVFERATFFAKGYRVLQWGPMVDRTLWSDPFVQMLNSLVLSGSAGE